MLGESWLNLLATAMGAGLPVFGAIWLMKHQAASQDRSQRELVAEAAAALRDEAYYLGVLLVHSSFQTRGQKVSAIRSQIDKLQEALNLWERYGAFTAVRSWDARLSISRMEREVRASLQVLQSERQWLDKPTDAVLETSGKKLGSAVSRILQSCDQVARTLKHRTILIDEREVQRRIAIIDVE
jgi:hypothetical protein